MLRLHAPAYCSVIGSLAARSGIRAGNARFHQSNAGARSGRLSSSHARPSLEMLLEDDNGHSRTVHIHKLIEGTAWINA
ncbi:MAG: hypothetical protein ACLR4A_05170 [Christensenellales bacterium]